METNTWVSTDTPISYMAPVINQMNARPWENLVISMLNVDLLRTAGMIPYQERNLAGSNRIMIFLTVITLNNYTSRNMYVLLLNDYM